MQLIDAAEMVKNSTTKTFTPGRKYVAYDSQVGEVEAIFVKATEAIAVDGAPMYPVTASYNVAGDFLCSDDENGSGVIGQEDCIGSWIGGVITAAAYGFVQTKGWNLVTITTDDSVTALDLVLPKAAADGTWLGSDPTEIRQDGGNKPWVRCGFAPEDDGGTTMAKQKVIWDVRKAYA